MVDQKLREKYVNKLNELEEIINSAEEGTIDYVIDSMYQIYKALIENNQFIGYVPEKPEFAKKVIRSHRYIPSGYLDYKGVDRIVFGGAYVLAEICLLPKEMVDKATDSRGAIMDPEAYGLPSEKEVNYGTRKIVNDHLVVAIKRGGWEEEEFTRVHQYDYVTLG